MTPEESQARLRAIARTLVGLREHLHYIAAYRAHGLTKAVEYHLEQMDRKARHLPYALRTTASLRRYVGLPAQRQVARLGIITLCNELGVSDDAAATRDVFMARMARVDNAARPWDASDDAGHEHQGRGA